MDKTGDYTWFFLIKHGVSNKAENQRSRKELWKTNDTDREEQDTGREALLYWELRLHKS